MADGELISIEEIFDAARSRTGAERAQFLDTACGGDAALREELESLLAAHDSDPRFLLQPAPRAHPLRASDVAHIGRRLGPWELLEPIGAGGMGSVWRARRADGAYEQEVAIKLVRRSSFGRDDELLRRFLAERRTLAALEHPAIARLVDAGSAPDGTPWFAMELVDGETIDRWCERERLDLRARVELFVRVCRAVQFAHGKLVAHRDLKPANILVQREQGGGVGLPKLLDFGIAKLLAAEPAHALDATTGPAPLTPAYASPEQFLGEPATTAADVYSLGVVLYRLVTGSLPYQLDGLAAHAAARRVCEAAPRPPREIATGVPADLETILLAALEKEPARRYAGAGAFADDLERFLSGHPIAARKASRAYRLRMLVRRNPIASALVVLVVLAVSGASIWLVALSQRAFDAEQLAEKRRERAESASKEAGEQRDAALAARKDEAERRVEAEQALELVRRLYAAPDPLEGQGADVKVVDVLDHGLRSVAEDASIAPLVRQSLVYVAGQTYLGLGRLDDAQRCFELCLALLEQEHALDTRDGLNARDALATVLQHRASFAEAATLYEMVLDGRRKLLGNEHADTLATVTKLANCLAELENYSRAQTLIEEALDAHRRRGEEEGDAALELLLVLASARSEHGDPLVAEELCLRAIESWSAREDEDRTIAIAHAKMLLARALWQALRFDESVVRYRESEAVFVERVGPDHDYVLGLHQNMARVLTEAGRAEEAVPLLEDVVERQTRLLGARSEVTLIAREALGQALRHARRTAEAVEVLGDAARDSASALGELDALTLETRAEHLYALGELGQAAEIELPLRDLIADLARKRSVEVKLAATVELTLGSTLVELGCFEEAERWLNSSRSTSAKFFGPASRGNYGALNVLRRLYSRWGRDADAHAVEQQAAAIFGAATARRLH